MANFFGGLFKSKPKFSRKKSNSSKWTSGIAWACAVFTIIINIVLNASGIQTGSNGVDGESSAILSFTAPYEELQTPVKLAYNYYLFPNAVCAQPAGFIDDKVHPYCVYTSLFTPFDLPDILKKGDVQVKKAMEFAFGGGRFPTKTARSVKMKPIDTIAPTVLYIIGGAFAFFSLVFIPKGVCGLNWFFGRKLLNLCVAFVSFASLAAASTLWTYKGKWIVDWLDKGDNPKFIENAKTGITFLAITWTATVFMLIATISLAIEYHRDVNATRKKEADRGDFKRLLDNEEGIDRTSKNGIQMTVREHSPQPPNRLEMPGYEPLRA